MVSQKFIWFVVLVINVFALSGINGQKFPYKQNQAYDGHRCGICPTYFQKVCGYDRHRNETYLFDNHCIMDLHNCIEGTAFEAIKYTKCIYFGNFAYVYGFKKEDDDYEDRHIIIEQTIKNPVFT